jgi:hypothetical protein
MVALLVAGRRENLDGEVHALLAGDDEYGYDRYIGNWACWLVALSDRDGPALRSIMDTQLAGLRSTGLAENWLTMFSEALTSIGEGGDYHAQLDSARRRAESEGRRADADCVLALAYAAACDGEAALAAELLGACGGALFRDTANYLTLVIIRDSVVRPLLDEETMHEATIRGAGQRLSAILAEHGLSEHRSGVP